jgi:dTDP-3-amino-3,4,6-trideoxy-alpha-D-glucose transaminase
MVARMLLTGANREIKVPFLDLAPVHEPLKAQFLADFADLIDSSAFTSGPALRRFETAFARYCGTHECVGVSSGLDALRLGLLAAGLEPGDEVIVPALTFAATFEAVVQAGGVPVPVDVSEADYNLDMAAVEAAIGPTTTFVMPVHLYGQMADMRRLAKIADTRGLTIVEDACQAHGARRDGLGAGAAGHAAAFSFYAGKNLGAMGDAGALVTDDEHLAGVVRALREHGQRTKYVHDLEGYTARLDTIQALVLARKLPLLPDWNAERRRIAAAYSAALRGVGDLALPPVPDGSDPVWHLYVVRTADPEALAAFLGTRGVASGRHYPHPPHLCAAYAWLERGPGAFPVTEALAAELLSLPIYPGMAPPQVDAVVRSVREYFGDA